MSPFDYSRRRSTQAHIGQVTIGYGRPIAVQSMTNASTLDTAASAEQIERIVQAGGDIVRLTAQSASYARNLANIKALVREHGCRVPLVADIHFTPDAAMVAAEIVEKVRINPGNFVDPARTFRRLEYTAAEYAAELARIEKRLAPLLDICKGRGVALRIGVNHGSLSDRIMSRYGNTPAGMVESAMEFLRIARAHDFNNVVISIKASNVTVMVETVRLLVRTMEAEGMAYPLHLGVTEAGDGEDGRVKSAVGIGALLAEGIGDTIRVSLSEAPEAEPPVARRLLAHIGRMADAEPIDGALAPGYDPVAPERRRPDTSVLPCPYPVVGHDIEPDALGDGVVVISSNSANYPGHAKAQLHRLLMAGDQRPAILKVSYPATMSYDDVAIAASVDLGAVLLSGFGDGLWIDAPHLPQDKLNSLSLGILQAARLRVSKTEYIACPSCGRTLFDLPSALAKVRAATSHLPGLKIAVMGCIVNGPGEMADADYGYVGAGAGNVSLYKGKWLVRKNIPADEALPLLIQLIKDNGDWKDAPSQD